MLEQLLAEMAGEYPALGEVFVTERDIFLTFTLQQAAKTGFIHRGLQFIQCNKNKTKKNAKIISCEIARYINRDTCINVEFCIFCTLLDIE